MFFSRVCSQEGRCFVDILFIIWISIGACGMTTWTHSILCNHSVPSVILANFMAVIRDLLTPAVDQFVWPKTGDESWSFRCHQTLGPFSSPNHEPPSLVFWTKENSPFVFSDPGCATSERFRNLGDEFFVGKKGSFGDFGGVVKCVVFQCFLCWDGMLFSLQSQIL